MRPLDHIEQATRDFRNPWRDFSRARAEGAGDWPRHCYAPLAVAQAIADKRPGGARPGDGERLAALAAWRQQKLVYRLTDNVAYLDAGPEATPEAMPAWCVYVPTATRRWRSLALGVYLYNDVDRVRVLLDLDMTLIPAFGSNGDRIASYLCDPTTQYPRLPYPRATRTKDGYRLFPARSFTIIEVT